MGGESNPFTTPVPKSKWGMQVQFEKKITIGNLIQIATLIVFAVIGFTVMQMRLDSIESNMKKVDVLEKEIVELERRLGSQYVRTEVFAEIKVQLADIKNEIKQLNGRAR
jgi:Tfp pilus assembly protein PilO